MACGLLDYEYTKHASGGKKCHGSALQSKSFQLLHESWMVCPPAAVVYLCFKLLCFSLKYSINSIVRTISRKDENMSWAQSSLAMIYPPHSHKWQSIVVNQIYMARLSTSVHWIRHICYMQEAAQPWMIPRLGSWRSQINVSRIKCISLRL